MLSKEELLKYKFELEVAYDGLGRGLDIADVKDAISLGIVGYEKMFNLLFNPKPYKLENLKDVSECQYYLCYYDSIGSQRKGTGFRNPPCEMYKRKASSVWRAFFD